MNTDKIFYLLCLSVFTGSGLLADTPDGPVGMLLAAGDAKVLRANTETPLDAKPTDLLFTGDAIRTGAAPATFLFCSGKTTQTLGPAGEARFEAAQVRVKTGKITAQKPAGSCFLPQVVRVSVASQQHYGVSMTRGLAQTEGVVIAIDALPPVVQTAIAPFDQVLKANPADVSPLVEEAAIFDRNKLEVTPLAAYKKIALAWTDAV